jgi:primosomal protein N' (replication factor Y)
MADPAGRTSTVTSAPSTTRKPAGPARAVPEIAIVDPVARLAVEMSLPHLDRPFDYFVPEALSHDVVPGSRVRVRFAGKLVTAFVLERLAESEHGGRLSFVERSVSPEPVLSQEVAALCRAVADRWAGTLADVLRLAVPPRHAAAETRLPAEPAADARPTAEFGTSWRRYVNGPQLLDSLAAGNPARAVWAALPGGSWPAEVADAVAASAASGAGIVVVLPDVRDVALVDQALTARLGAGRHAVLTADLGPARRYRRFLAISRGDVRIAIGTRAAAFAPVRDLGLVVIWDDGDDLHAEQRAPYPHARDVLILRAHLAGAAAIIGGHAVTAEAARLVETGWARLARAERLVVRDAAPRIVGADDPAAGRNPSPGGARLPPNAWAVAREALAADLPVLVQVPRAGYLPVLACDSCRAPVRCGFCNGPVVGSGAGTAPGCRWCGRLAVTSGTPAWRCSHCGGSRFRAVVVGASRTAEELGKGFPGVSVRTSAAGQVLDTVPTGRSIVVATPGAEPVVTGGYGAALLLDGWMLLSRTDLRAGEEAVRRWLNAAALVRSAVDGGQVVLLGDAGLRPVQSVIRWDPVGHAEHELAERGHLDLPPAVDFAEVQGDVGAVEDLLAAAELPVAAAVLGPVPVAGPSFSAAAAEHRDVVRALIRAPRSASSALAQSLHTAQSLRSARKAAGSVRVRIDPVDIG